MEETNQGITEEEVRRIRGKVIANLLTKFNKVREAARLSGAVLAYSADYDEALSFYVSHMQFLFDSEKISLTNEMGTTTVIVTRSRTDGDFRFIFTDDDGTSKWVFTFSSGFRDYKIALHVINEIAKAHMISKHDACDIVRNIITDVLSYYGLREFAKVVTDLVWSDAVAELGGRYSARYDDE